MPMHSSPSAVVHVSNSIFKATDIEKYTCLALLDYSKAFDILNHQILCSKLKYYGATNNATKMIQSFLSYRYQRAFLNE